MTTRRLPDRHQANAYLGSDLFGDQSIARFERPHPNAVKHVPIGLFLSGRRDSVGITGR